MEQTFVCLQFGFVEFANPHLLVAVLAWQHPVLGCYTNKKPESVPNMGLSADFRPPAKAETSNQSNVESKFNFIKFFIIRLFLCLSINEMELFVLNKCQNL